MTCVTSLLLYTGSGRTSRRVMVPLRGMVYLTPSLLDP